MKEDKEDYHLQARHTFWHDNVKVAIPVSTHFGPTGGKRQAMGAAKVEGALDCAARGPEH